MNDNNFNWLICSLLTFVLFLTMQIAVAQGQTIKIYEPFSELFNSPLGLEFAKHEPDHIYLVERRGQIKQLNMHNPDQESVLWFDIGDRIETEGEGGLLGLTFHPDFPSNNTFYINYTINDEDGQMYTRISKFNAPGGVSDVSSENILLEFEQPQDNHNGGQLAFGPDGYLYIALGDGGRHSRLNSQDTQNIYGSILRIDIDQTEGYKIPEDNPFVDSEEGLDEIYAWGFRNPWRMSFDPVTGYLWVADVGQQEWESIYIVEKGKNYGWSVIEGSHCYIFDDCDKNGLEMPIFEYPWGGDDWGNSVTGGYVYRGSDNPSLYGKYIYGDFISGRIWALEIDLDSGEVISNKEIISTDFKIPSFGIDSSGEIYILRFQGDFSRVYRLEPESSVSPPDVVVLQSPANEATGISVDTGFEWLESEQANEYTIRISKSADFNSPVWVESVTGTGFTPDEDLDYETIYYWQVEALNEEGSSGWSDPWSFTTQSSPVAENLVLNDLEDAIELEWQLSANSEIIQFNIYRGHSINELELLERVPGHTVEYVDSDLPEGASLYAVTAVDLNIQESDFSNIVSYYNTVSASSQDWKLMSIPIQDEGIELLNSEVFGFNRVYQSTNTLLPLNGYWIKSTDGEDYQIRGTGMEEASVTLNRGWNLIGGLIDLVHINDIEDQDGILNETPIYGYNGTVYEETEILNPMQGYWIYANEAGEISYMIDIGSISGSEVQSETTIASSVNSDFADEPDKIIFSLNGKEIVIRTSADHLEPNVKNRYRLPPPVPDPVLDVRTVDGFRIAEGMSTEINVKAASYPVGIQYLQGGNSGIEAYNIVTESDGVKEIIELNPGVKQMINKAYDRVFLEPATEQKEINHSTELKPAYPNPFNPVTQITYQIEEQTEVMISVYDISGRRIATLLNEEKSPGTYNLQFNGANLASGIYFLRMQAGDYTNTQKLMLIK